MGDPFSLIILVGAVSLLPLLIVASTAFLKISIVMSLLRNALGVQQVPSNLALYGLALILTAYIMAPVFSPLFERLTSPGTMANASTVMSGLQESAEPLRKFMMRFSQPEHRDFFLTTAKRMWGAEASANVAQSDFLILMPAFVVSELAAAFQIGFLLYLPFIVIDLIISNVLLAMGMMMVSPVTISLPLKLFLFVAVDGWTRLIGGLVLSYV
ncbi:type III secretion system export apparatus subunit SctR [Imbroritus primus]|uniref:type III secretion system export apparatus subunit SctR n=1 Tax=Imbroritus primus TaxID=3058603 RepID=UPI003D1611C1